MTESRTTAHVLIVHDDRGAIDILNRLLASEAYAIDIAGDIQSASSAIERQPPDLVLIPVSLEGSAGVELCRRLKQDPATRLIPVVMIADLADRAARIAALNHGADDIVAQPVDADEFLARIRSLVRMKRYTDDLDSAASIIMAMAELIESRDGNTEGHCHRMANYATALGRALGLSPDDVQVLHRGGFLHDIGMLAIPDAILRKVGPLAPEEYELIKSHTVLGESLCGTLRSLQSVRPIIRHHHELLDGSGYPDGLSGDAIPLVAQIIGVVDVFDAVTTERPYRGARPTGQAMDLLRDQVDRGWRQRTLVETFAGLVERGTLETYRG